MGRPELADCSASGTSAATPFRDLRFGVIPALNRFADWVRC
jgi:hypothetical protein